nr:Peptidase M12A domain containing protein [Haemonchus contortus]
MGDSLNEVNENSNVEDQLFQSDILLTETQAEIVIKDIDEQVGGSNRTKRQALADPTGVKLWKTGVNYYFSPSLNSKTKRAFLMGADMWQKYSCINFIHNPYAEIQPPAIEQNPLPSSFLSEITFSITFCTGFVSSAMYDDSTLDKNA